MGSRPPSRAWSSPTQLSGDVGRPPPRSFWGWPTTRAASCTLLALSGPGCARLESVHRGFSLLHWQGLLRVQPGSKPRFYLKNPEKINPARLCSGWRGAPASLHTRHAQGVERQVGLGSRDESGSACALLSAQELVLFRALRTGAVRREPLAVPTPHPIAPQQCPATASPTTSSTGEERRRSWVRRRPQPFPPLAHSASSAAIRRSEKGLGRWDET